MQPLRDELAPLASTYATEKTISLLRFLGDGNDGAVWETNRETAVKVLERSDSYQRELDAYVRLQNRQVCEIDGFAVPQLIDHHDTLQVVEMTIVFPRGIYYFDAKPGNIRFEGGHGDKVTREDAGELAEIRVGR